MPEDIDGTFSKILPDQGSVKPPHGGMYGPEAPDRAVSPNGTPAQRSADTEAPREPQITELDGRDYRDGPVRGAMLPTGLVRSTGLLTHQGTPREEWAVLALAAHLAGIDPEDDGVRYRNRHRGTLHVVRREDGTIWKSRQSFTEDLRRRLYKRATAPADGELRDDWTKEFARDYDRIRHATDRVGAYLSNEGAPTSTGIPTLDCLNGRRWRMDEGMRDLPEAPEQRDSVRCTGPEPTIDTGALHIDVLDALEQIVAHRENLHEAFTAGWKQQKFRGEWAPRKAKTNADLSHAHTARHGSGRPQFVSVGRFRPEEIGRDELKGKRACTVPWTVFDIDAPGDTVTEKRANAHELAERLLARIRRHTTPRVFSDVQAVATGGGGIHVYLPAGATGNRVYANAAACKRALRRFADRLCEGDDELRNAIDDTVLDPHHVVRMIGSTHEDGGRVVATDAIDFLGNGSLFLWGHSEAGRFQSYGLPDPTSTPFCPSLSRLLDPTPKRHRGGDRHTVAKRPSTGEYERAKEVQYEGEKWGRDVDKPDLIGRNRAALTVSLVACTRSSTPWVDVRAWNRDMAEPLPEAELRKTFESARRYVGG